MFLTEWYVFYYVSPHPCRLARGHIIITSCVSGRGNRIGPVCLFVCVSVSLTTEPFDIRTSFAQNDFKNAWRGRCVNAQAFSFLQEISFSHQEVFAKVFLYLIRTPCYDISFCHWLIISLMSHHSTQSKRLYWFYTLPAVWPTGHEITF